MYAPTTQWDRGPTDAELTQFYGKDKSTAVRDEYFAILTEAVRKVPMKNLALDYVQTYKDNGNYRTRVAQYPVTEVIADYGTDADPMAALIAVFEKSDCPLVAKFREALAERFSYLNADELEEVRA